MPDPRKKLYLFYGPDEYRVSEEAKALVETLVPPAEQAFGLESFDGRQERVDDIGRAVRQTIEATQTLGFFGANKVVWLRDVTFIAPSRQKSASDDPNASDGRKEHVAKLRALLAAIPDGHTLVLSGASIDSRYGGIVNDALKMEKAGTANVCKFDLPSKGRMAEEAANLLVAESKKRKHPLSQDLCRAIVARAGTNSRQLVSELEKLLLFAGDADPTPEDVVAIVSPTAETEAWDLLDEFGARRLDKALPTLHRLLDAGVSDIMLVIQLQYRVNDLLLVRDCLDRKLAVAGRSFHWAEGLPEATQQAVDDLGDRAKRSVNNPYTSFKLVDQAKHWTRLELRTARHILDHAHERMTSVAMPRELVLELAIAEALQRKAAS